MKTHLKLAALALLLSAINHQLSTCFAQGSLTPPGAPAATMKSLDQIEPRTPISAVPFTISEPGSYYLTTNVITTVSNAITISVSGVTLDLSGFTIASTVDSAANGGTAILLGSGLSDITIFNGHIRSGVTNNGSGVYSGSGFNYGIYYSGTAPVNTRISGVSVAGCLYYGIFLHAGDSTVVEACTVRTMGSYGILASTIKSCVAVDCGDSAVFGIQVSDSYGQSPGSGYGLFATMALNCYGSSSNFSGLFAYTAQNCYGSSSSSGYGLFAYTAQNCWGFSGSSVGLSAFTAQNCLGYSFGSGYTGIEATYSAHNCYGLTAGQGYGIKTLIAQDCYGESSANGFGVYAKTATGCYGKSTTVGGVGLSAGTATSCAGEEAAGGIAIQATIANSCIVYSGTTSITYKYNMP